MGHALETLQLWMGCVSVPCIHAESAVPNGALTNGNICFVDF